MQRPGSKVEIKNCQTWLADVVSALYEKEIVDSNVVEIIRTAPKN